MSISAVLTGRLFNKRSATFLLTFVSFFCTARYTYWRWTSTIRFLNNNGWKVDPWGLFFGFLLLAAEGYAVVILLLGYFQSARPLQRRPVPMPKDDAEWPTVDVFIPTYNEPLEVVRPTVLAASAIDWPAGKLKVHLLDDGRRPEFKQFAEECGVSYMTRTDNFHAKAGNINSALKQTTGELVAIFDCDHIATRSFLQMTVGWFLKDRRLAMLQTPHHFYSPDPFERNLGVFRKVPNEGSLFYGIVQQGSDLWNATFFCGSCAVIRRTALEQIGGIAVETVTEDAHTSLRMQRLGWNTAYIGIPQAAGLATGSLAAHIGQRIRWARGMVQILRIECPLFVRGLKMSQRLCYFNSVVHFLYAFPRLIFLTAPLVYLILGKSNLYGSLWEIIAYAAPHLVLSSITNSRVQGSHRHSFWNEVYETILAPYILLPTTFALINPKWGKFNVTSKGSVVDEKYFDFKVARPYLVLIALNFIGIGLAIPRYLSQGDPTGALGINVLWASINTLLLGTSIAVATEKQQRRSTARIKSNIAAQVVVDPQTVHFAKVVDISEGGVALQLQRPTNLSSGSELEVALQQGEEGHRFRAEIVAETGNLLRLRFASADLEHYRAITRVVYSRADSWINWTDGQDADNILQSLVKILSIGLYGIAGLPGLLLRRGTKAQDAAEAMTPDPSSRVRPAVISGLILLLLVVPALLMRGAETRSANGIDGKGTTLTTEKEKALPGSPSFHDKQDLATLGRQSAITLRGDDAKSTVFVGIASTKVVSTAVLNVHYRVSSAESGSTLDISLNETPVASVPLDEGNTPGAAASARIELPSDLFIRDNALTFRFKATCLAPCNSPAGTSVPSLRIDPSTELETAGVEIKLPNDLANLPAPFFDASFRRAVEVPIVFSDQPNAVILRAAGIVSSWFGVLADYRGIHCPAQVGSFPHGNAVLLTTSTSALASQLNISSGGPSIAIRDNPADPYGKVLAITGATDEQVIEAAKALALGQFAHTGELAEVRNFQEPAPRAAYDAPTWLASGQKVRIAASISAGLLRATASNAARIYFRLAPDLYFGERNSVPLTVSYRLSNLPTFAKAQMHIRLNGTFIAARPLQNKGNENQQEIIAIPTSLIYASNTLTIDLLPAGQDAAAGSLEDADLAISRTTDLDLRGVAHDVRMPRLDLFASSGFPFTKFADLSSTTVVMPERYTGAQLSTYLDAVGLLGAQTGYPGIRLNVVTKPERLDENSKDLLILGSGDDQPLLAAFQPYLPVAANSGSFSLRSDTGFWTSVQHSDWLSADELWQRITTHSWRSAQQEERDLGNLLAGDTKPYFFISEFTPSSFNANRTAVVLATTTAEVNDQIIAKLSEAARDGKIRGSISLLDSEGFHSYSLKAHSYYLNGMDWFAAINYWISYHLLWIPVLVFLCAAYLAKVWMQYLEKRAEQRLQIGA